MILAAGIATLNLKPQNLVHVASSHGLSTVSLALKAVVAAALHVLLLKVGVKQSGVDSGIFGMFHLSICVIHVLTVKRHVIMVASRHCATSLILA